MMEHYKPKLQVGDIIKIHGFIMLQGIDSSFCYEVTSISNGAYYFCRLNHNGSRSKRKNARIGHLIKNVDPWIGTQDGNRAEIIQG
jgi:hypothetical protein